MQNYFISHTEPRERGLREANIPFESFQMERQKGLVFEDRHLTQALAALNSQVDGEDRSPYDGIRVLRLRRGGNDANPIPSTIRVTSEGLGRGDSSLKRSFEDIAREFAPLFGVAEVVLKNNDGVGQAPRVVHDGKLYIHFWASAVEHSPISRHPVALFGVHVGADRWRFPHRLSSDPAALVIRDFAGSVVGEMIGNNIYIHYPLAAAEREGVQIFRAVVEEALALRGTPEQRAERQRQHEARLLEEVRTMPVVVDRWDASREQREKFVAVATEFAPVFGKQIHIHNYCEHSQTHYPINNGRLHICIWASPGDTKDGGPMQATLFGAPLTSDDRSQCILKPVGEEGQLLTDEDGNQIGKMIGDTIYIHYPLGRTYLRLRWNNKGPDALFRRMLEEVVFFKTATEEQKSARARALSARYRAQSREEYIRACNGRFDKALESTQKALKNSPAEVRQLQEQLVLKIREVNGLQRKLQQMENCRPSAVEAYGKEFDKLLEVPKIREVRVRDGVIQVFTDTLYCVDTRSKKKHEIGHFRIEFNANGSVRWYNLARRVRDMQAPHVFNSGEACLGNMSEVIPELAANYEFAALAMVCIQFVESVNVDDQAGTHIDKWPVAAS